MQFKYPF